MQHNQELAQKLEEEKKKYDGLLDEKLELDEKLLLANRALEQTKFKLKEQDDFIAHLKSLIEKQT